MICLSGTGSLPSFPLMPWHLTLTAAKTNLNLQATWLADVSDEMAEAHALPSPNTMHSPMHSNGPTPSFYGCVHTVRGTIAIIRPYRGMLHTCSDTCHVRMPAQEAKQSLPPICFDTVS